MPEPDAEQYEEVEMPEPSARQAIQPDESLPRVLEGLSKIRDEVAKTKDWYKKHAQRPMVLFRIFGVLVIILSVSVPFLGTLEGVWKTTVLPVATLLIAALTGLNSFFQWQTQWQGFRQTQFKLEYLISKWEMEIIRAKEHPDKEKGAEIAIKATDVLLDQAREATASETGGFFGAVQLPALPAKQ